MFRNLIPRLAGSFHLIAPDYPGFGQSSMPDHNALHMLDTGHFALETHGEEIAARIEEFLGKQNLNR